MYLKKQIEILEMKTTMSKIETTLKVMPDFEDLNYLL